MKLTLLFVATQSLVDISGEEFYIEQLDLTV